MNIINTVAPISLDNLKIYFAEKNSLFLIDYKNSSLKGKKLLTYLGNLNVPCDINFEGNSTEEIWEIIAEYLNTTSLIDVPILENIVIQLLLEKKGILANNNKELIQRNETILDDWILKLEGLTLYNMYIVADNCFGDFINEFESDDTTDLKGINFVSLLKRENFYSFYEKMSHEKPKFYTHLFKEYIYKGKNMYEYWANKNNPMFLLTFGIASGVADSKQHIEAKIKFLEELSSMEKIKTE